MRRSIGTCDLDATDSGLTTDINRDDQKSLLTTQNDWAIVNFSGNGVIGRSGIVLSVPSSETNSSQA